MLTIKRLHHRIFTFLLLLLLAGGTANEAWAATVTYHILTLPINPSVYDYHMKVAVTGYRLEAVKVVVNDQTTVELPAHYKSPLATGFTYYKPEDITYHGSSAVSLYDGVASRKGILYKVNGEDTPGDTSDDATFRFQKAQRLITTTPPNTMLSILTMNLIPLPNLMAR